MSFKSSKLFIRNAALAVALIVSCNKKEDEKKYGSLQMSMRVAQSDSSAALALADATPDDFRSTAITSGAPDELKLTIHKMTLENKAEGKQFTVFSDDAGKEIIARSGKIDLSALFTRYACIDKNGSPVEGLECPCGLDADNKPVEKDEKGLCPLGEDDTIPAGIMEVQEGTFDNLRVEFGIAAKMKGCVTGNYSAVGNAAVTGIHTYCTNADKTTFQAAQGGTNADFEIGRAAASEMQIQLGGLTPMPKTVGSTNGLDFPIKGGIAITADATANLTMVIDTNRILRFYNQNTPDQAPNPGMPTGTSYFFTGLVFDNSVFVFVGKPGEIRGFQTWTEACNATPKPADRICADATSTNVVSGWVTVVKDADGKPLALGLNPDDDNTLTIIKGSNKSMTGIDADAFVANGTHYDLGYKLGSEGGGTLYNVNLDAEVGTTQSTTFDCKIQSNDYYGKVYVRRLL